MQRISAAGGAPTSALPLDAAREEQAGQKGSRQLAQRLQDVSIRAHIVQLPHGHDPRRVKKFKRPNCNTSASLRVAAGSVSCFWACDGRFSQTGTGRRCLSPGGSSRHESDQRNRPARAAMKTPRTRRVWISIPLLPIAPIVRRTRLGSDFAPGVESV